MVIASRLLPLSLVAVPLVFAACGGEGLTLPREGEPARIEILEGGNSQSGRVNEVLPVTLKVRVTDSRGEPVPGSDVLFSFAGGAAAGVPTPESATTNGDGQASTTLALGNVAGTHKGTAQVQSAPAVSAEFTVIALPADANGIRIVSGDPQSATVNSALPEPLVVLVTDANDNPIPNVAIQWTAEGGGTVSAESNVTDGNGQASVTRTLGPTAGTQTTRADAGPIAGSPAIFTHTAMAGGAAGITKVSGDNQSGAPGTELALPLIVEVRDEQGNPISGRAVAWVVGTGGGSVSAQTTPTNAEGRATTNWTLGPAVGANSVNAVVSGVGTATFNATATAGSPSAANSEVSAAPTSITVGGQSTITVEKTSSIVEITADEPDPSTANEDVTVEFTVRGSGGTPTGEVVVTISGGSEECRGTLTAGAGSCVLKPLAAGPSNNNNRRIITATYGGDAQFSGDTDTENHRVNPAPQPNQAPTAVFTPPSCTVGVPCQFTDGSTDSDGIISDRFWTFQDAVPSTSGEQNPTVIFSSERPKAVTLEVTDNEGATDTETQQVTVTLPTPVNQAPTAGNDAYTTPGAGQGLTVPAPGVLSNDTDPDGPQ